MSTNPIMRLSVVIKEVFLITLAFIIISCALIYVLTSKPIISVTCLYMYFPRRIAFLKLSVKRSKHKYLIKTNGRVTQEVATGL
jgi:hypothetical protein